MNTEVNPINFGVTGYMDENPVDLVNMSNPSDYSINLEPKGWLDESTKIKVRFTRRYVQVSKVVNDELVTYRSASLSGEITDVGNQYKIAVRVTSQNLQMNGTSLKPVPVYFQVTNLED